MWVLVSSYPHRFCFVLHFVFTEKIHKTYDPFIYPWSTQARIPKSWKTKQNCGADLKISVGKAGISLYSSTLFYAKHVSVLGLEPALWLEN